MKKNYPRFILNQLYVPIPADDEQYWAWHNELTPAKKSVLACILAQDTVDNIVISTIFTGVANIGYQDTKPMLFETMVTGGKWNKLIRRYVTYEDAMGNHDKILGNIMSETNVSI